MNWPRYLSFLLCFLGTLQILGATLGSSRLVAIGWMSAAAPLPLVFNQVGGVEYWAAEYRVEARTLSGERIQRKIDAGTYEKMPGPHFVHMAYTLPLALAPIVPAPIWTIPLQYGFCTSHYYQKALGIQEQILEATVLMKPRSGDNLAVRQYRIRCQS